MSEAHGMQLDTLITNASLHNRKGRWCIGINHRQFSYVGQTFTGGANYTIDANGKLLLPGLLEPHAHLDKTYTWQDGDAALPPTTSALRQAIVRMQAVKASRTPESITVALRRALNRAISFGVSGIRSHIDIGEERDLHTVRQLLAVRDEYRDLIKIEYTALGSCDTLQQEKLLRLALSCGVDHVGGAPALSADPRKALATLFALAEQVNKPLDLHIDETENPTSPCLEALAELVVEHQFKQRVMASHCCSLAFTDTFTRSRILTKVKVAGIHLVSLPACNLVLMGRRDLQPKPRGALPVDELLRANIPVSVGTDNVGDFFQPWGDYDPLRSAALCAEVAQIDEPERVFTLASSAVASAFGIDDYGIAVGNRADCSLLDAASLREALSESPLRTHVFFSGKLILQQQLQQQWS